MDTNALDLRKLINPSPKSIWVQYKDTGISFEVNFMSKARFKVLTDQCSSLVYNAESKTHQPKIDTKKLAAAYVEQAVKGWKGVTPKSLAAIAPVELSNLTEEQRNTELAYSADSMKFLVESTFELDTFLQEVTMNPALFNQTVVPFEDAAKNSKSS